ncbi:hypothetical protein ACG0Z6_11625 [Roseateles sp. BYS180W]|uniref:YtkA-like domain-containing protein n=1 Tax=Roseateles rivi TaxID=3299028 RepID=A0ABW7FX65_9BURK
MVMAGFMLGAAAVMAQPAESTEHSTEQSACVELSLQVSHNAQALPALRLLLVPGQMGSAALEGGLRISVTATEQQGAADLQFSLGLQETGGRREFAKPRVATPWGHSAELQATAPNGQRYRLQWVARLVACNINDRES